MTSRSDFDRGQVDQEAYIVCDKFNRMLHFGKEAENG